MRQNILLIDVGSHKAEEVRLIEARHRYSLRSLARLARRKRFSPSDTWAEIQGIRRTGQQISREFAFRYVLIEPIPHKALMDFVSRTHHAMLIEGVSSCEPSGDVPLFLSSSSLGHSIVASKPGLSGNSLVTFNHHFPVLYQYLIDTFIKSGVCTRTMLRMNAEGVEGPIIDYLSHVEERYRPCCLAGSLGDIRKCFGQAEYDRALRTLEDSNIPFIYFTSNESTWNDALEKMYGVLTQK